MAGDDDPPVGIIGASGYVGSLLVDHYASTGRPVVGISRRGVTAPRQVVRDVRLDVRSAEPSALRAALDGCRDIFYLIHSLDEDDFVRREAAAARRVVEALSGASSRVVYLGSLGSGEQSNHLRSRHQVGRMLREGLDTVELGASFVVGRGSKGFDILVEVITRWGVLSSLSTRRRCQPIAAADVVHYLSIAHDMPGGRYDIGGPDVVTYRQLAELCARICGSRLRFLPIPTSTLPMSAGFVSSALGISTGFVDAMFQSLRTDMVAADDAFMRSSGHVPVPLADAIRVALEPDLTRSR
jgi:uncharacterized protein YbjT (DUF2867 family)